MMRILIVEDDLASRKVLDRILSQYGETDVTVDGIEAIEAFLMAHDEGNPYDLICLDIMMPKIDGIRVLKLIRDLEKERKIEAPKHVKVIMTTALNERNMVRRSFDAGCEAYATKPIDAKKLVEAIEKLGLLTKE